MTDRQVDSDLAIYTDANSMSSRLKRLISCCPANSKGSVIKSLCPTQQQATEDTGRIPDDLVIMCSIFSCDVQLCLLVG